VIFPEKARLLWNIVNTGFKWQQMLVANETPMALDVCTYMHMDAYMHV
jgi:hypothetical protein